LDTATKTKTRMKLPSKNTDIDYGQCCFTGTDCWLLKLLQHNDISSAYKSTRHPLLTVLNVVYDFLCVLYVWYTADSLWDVRASPVYGIV